ncbi:MAG: Holliday junction branch migration protein RuvA [Enterobacterales bacterium]|nr:Holliday junction branch migration protein RuvA [Enterobacterales bacterium]
MIGRVRGILIDNDVPLLLLETSNGVAYEIQAPTGTCAQMPAVGEEVILHTHLSISENAHQLYGFATRRDRQLFRNLIKINGVGPKLALSVLSAMSPEEFVAHILADEVNVLVKIPGIGKKTAERLVIELRDKVADWQDSLPSRKGSAGGEQRVVIQQKGHEVEAALLALGYKPQVANQILSNLAEDVDFATTETSELIRLALKSLN